MEVDTSCGKTIESASGDSWIAEDTTRTNGCGRGDYVGGRNKRVEVAADIVEAATGGVVLIVLEILDKSCLGEGVGDEVHFFADLGLAEGVVVKLDFFYFAFVLRALTIVHVEIVEEWCLGEVYDGHGAIVDGIGNAIEVKHYARWAVGEDYKVPPSAVADEGTSAGVIDNAICVAQNKIRCVTIELETQTKAVTV